MYKSVAAIAYHCSSEAIGFAMEAVTGRAAVHVTSDTQYSANQGAMCLNKITPLCRR
jgi:hypothetical protein